MSNQWLRLWHDMPNDPKWRTIARISKQPISLVISVYMHILVSASQNVTRGHTDVTDEDLASGLDVTESQINDILNAMQDRVLNGNKLTGWESRQVKKEDSFDPETGVSAAAMRKRAERERKKAEREALGNKEKSRDVTPMSRDVTTEKIREDKNRLDKESNNKKTTQKKSDFKLWKPFFDSYPENKKGGSDASAWAAAKRYGLDDEDFKAMLADVEQRRKLTPSWYATYALGICNYIKERFWLTPIIPDPPPNGPSAGVLQNEPITTSQGFVNRLAPHLAAKLLSQSDGDLPSVEAGSHRRPESVGGRIPSAIAQRDA